MLSTLFLTSCLLVSLAKAHNATSNKNCSLLGQRPDMQAGMNNYVIDWMGRLPFPYALNQCTITNASSTYAWAKYTCTENMKNKTWTVTKTEYNTPLCSSVGVKKQVWEEDKVHVGMIGYFECGGNNTYAKLALSSTDQCVVSSYLYAGLGGCVSKMPMHMKLDVICNDTSAVFQMYMDDNSDNDTSSEYSSTFMASSSMIPYNETTKICDVKDFCTKMVVSKGKCRFLNTDMPVFAQMEECTGKLETFSTTASPKSTTTSKSGSTTTSKSGSTTTSISGSTTTSSGSTTTTSSSGSTTTKMESSSLGMQLAISNIVLALVFVSLT